MSEFKTPEPTSTDETGASTPPFQSAKSIPDLHVTDPATRITNIVANVPGIVFETRATSDPNQQSVRFVSSYVEEMLGYSVDEWLSKPDFWLSIVHAEDRDRVERAVTGIANLGSIRNTLEFRWVAKDGHVLWVQSNCVAVIDEAGKPVGLRGVMLDITRRKRAEAAVGESEQRYRLLFDGNPAPMWVYDLASLQILEVNEATIAQYGYSREEFLEMRVIQMRAEERLDLHDAESEWSSNPFEGMHVRRHQTKDGRLIDVELKIHNIDFNGRPSAIVIANDVTKHRAVEEHLRQRQRLESVGMLAGGIAHDFNNLLLVINGYTELALLSGEANSAATAYLEEIRNAGESAAGLTKQLLAFSRQQILEPEIVDLNKIVLKTKQMLARLIGEKVELVTLLAESLGKVEVDPSQVEQMVVNLVVNGRDAMPHGGRITIETMNVFLDSEYALTHVSVNPGHYVVLAISDNGSGMDKETCERIFEPFFSTKKAGQGTGLGLSTTYGSVKQSGGNIWVYSEPGVGTTFKIYLPVVGGATPASSAVPGLALPREGAETILIAEDEPRVRDIARQILESYGYSVLVAANGSDALQLLHNHLDSIDLLMTDLGMPDMTGRELGVKAHAVAPDLKVLFMSGYTSGAVAANDVLDDEKNFIQKPFSAGDLARKVRETLDAGV